MRFRFFHLLSGLVSPLIPLFLCAIFFAPAPVWAMAKKPPAEEPLEIPAPQAAVPQKVMTLGDCFALSLKQSDTIAIKNIDIEKTWADFLKASGILIGEGDFTITDFLQQKDTSGGDFGTTSNATTTNTAPERRQRTFAFSQPLFQGFKSLAGFTAVGSLKKQRVSDRNRAEQLLFLDVARAYHAVLRSDHAIGINEDIRKLLKERMEELVDWEKIGRSRSSEIANAETDLRIVEANLAKSRGEKAIQLRLLEFLTGVPLMTRDFLDIKSEPTPPDPLETFLKFARSRPDVEAARQNVKTVMQSMVSAQSALWPQISLNHNYYEKREGYQAPIHWDVLFTIDVPLYRGGTTLGNIKEAYSNWKQAKHLYSQTLRQAVLDIKRAYESWVSSYEQFKSLKLAVQAAERNYTLQKEDYAHNLVSNLEVLRALEYLNNARLSYNTARYDLLDDFWILQVATGTCCQTPQELH